MVNSSMSAEEGCYYVSCWSGVGGGTPEMQSSKTDLKTVVNMVK